MNRKSMLKNLGSRKKPWDIVVIGGGATGLGVAVDAASRGTRCPAFSIVYVVPFGSSFSICSRVEAQRVSVIAPRMTITGS